MLNKKILKTDTGKFFKAVDWCNANDGYIIFDKGDYYEVIEDKIPAPSLDERKQAKLQSLKSERDKLEVEPIAYQGNVYDYDDKARDRINAAIIALDLQGPQSTIEWTLADNTNATVTANDLRAVIGAVALRSNDLHVKYRLAKEQAEACKTEDELNKIVLL